MIKLSNIIIDEKIISVVEPKFFNETPTLFIETKDNNLKIAIYKTEEDRDKALLNLQVFLDIQCC